MANENDISGKVGLDISDFKANISALNQQIKVIETGFKASAAGMDDWGSNADGLQARIKSLTDVMGLQQQKIDNLKSMYAQIAAAKGEDSRAAQDLQIKINNETAAFNKNQLELKDVTDRLNNLGKETDDAGTEVKQLGDKMDDAGKKTSIFGDVLKANFLSDAIIGGIRAIGNAIQNGFSKLKELTFGAMDSADSLVALSSETGLTTEQLQTMQYVGDDLGVSLETQTGALSKLVKNMSGAKDGTGTAAEAFKTLGISVTDANGNLRDSNTVYAEALSALGGVGNETERDALAMSLFGKSARELNPLIEAGADGLAQLEQQAKDTGAVMSEETVAALDSLGDSVDHLKQSAQTAAGTFVAQFAPALSNVANGFSALVAGSISVDDFMARVNILVTQVASAITAALPTIIQVGGGILTALISGIISALPAMIPAAVQVVMQLTNTLLQTLPLLISAALQIITQLALGITQAIPTMIPTIVSVVMQIVQTLMENLPMLIDAALQLIMALAQGLITALPQLIAAIPQIITTLVTTLTNPDMLTQLIMGALTLIIALAGGLIKAIPELIKAIPQIITAIVIALENGLQAIANVGKNLVSGLWNGIKEKSAWLKEQISGWCQNILNSVKEFFGIHSPSTVFANMGGFMAQGLGIGFEDGMAAVSEQMNKSIPTSFEVNGRVNEKMGESIVNGMAAVMGNAQTSGIQQFNLVLDNGTVIASWLLDPLRGVIKQRGVAFP